MTASAEIPGADRLTRDVICAVCGYNLRSLSPHATCPECATPVRHSLAVETLPLPDARWLKLVIAGTLLTLTLTPFNLLWFLQRFPATYEWQRRWVDVVLSPTSFNLQFTAWLAGAFLITAAPSFDQTQTTWFLRWAVRILVAFEYLTYVVPRVLPVGVIQLPAEYLRVAIRISQNCDKSATILYLLLFRRYAVRAGRPFLAAITSVDVLVWIPVWIALLGTTLQRFPLLAALQPKYYRLILLGIDTAVNLLYLHLWVHALRQMRYRRARLG